MNTVQKQDIIGDIMSDNEAGKNRIIEITTALLQENDCDVTKITSRLIAKINIHNILNQFAIS